MNGDEKNGTKKSDKNKVNILKNVKTDLITESRLRSKNFKVH